MTNEPENWETEFAVCWKYFVPPARPSPSDVEHLRKLIRELVAKKGKENVKIMLMGCTAEFRKLCVEEDIPPTLVDFNPFSYKIISKETQGHPKEKFVLADWRTMTYENEFDLIYGDVVMNITFPKDHKTILKNLRTALKQDGFFAVRTYIHYPEEKHTLASIFSEYRKNRLSWGLYTGTIRDICLITQNKETFTATYADIWKTIKEAHEKGFISDEELQEYKNFGYHKFKMIFHIPPNDFFNNLLTKFFDIDYIFHATEPYVMENHPTHVLKKKTESPNSPH